MSALGKAEVCKGVSKMQKVVVYTCAVGRYDWIHCPQVKPAGIDFLRFSDIKPWRLMGWQHRTLPPTPGAQTARGISRFPKLRPHDVLHGYNIAVWIDSSVEISGDITPLLHTFGASGADVALFPHRGGHSVAEEIETAIEYGRIPPEMYDQASRQRERYAAAGLLDCRVVEASIIFYRLPSEALRRAGQLWWEEVTTYTERDQVSQPYAMRDDALNIHLWDWHFEQENPYFRRIPHRPENTIERLKIGARYLGDNRLDYRLVRSALRGGKAIRHAGRSLLSRP